MNTLKLGLSNIIALVEKLSDDTIFDMNVWDECVIGQTIGWNYDTDSIIETGDWKTLNEVFGLNKPLLKMKSAFCGWHDDDVYTIEEWEVISLFTKHIGDHLTKFEWLEIAKDQLEKMA